jgi:hypothetical protein
MGAIHAVRGAPRTALHVTAVGYAHLGWAVFPLKPASKVPATRNGCRDATTDVEQVERWWRRADYNIGIATGTISGLVVVDLDGRRGFDSCCLLQDIHGDLPSTTWCLTGSGGWHAYFTHPGGLRNSASKVARGIDIRGEGGYVVAPPSIHPDGDLYSWHTRTAPAPLPEWLAHLIDPPAPVRHGWTAPAAATTAYASAAVRAEAEAVARAANGTRNDQLVRSAFSLGTLVGAGELDAEQATGALLDAAQGCGLPPREAARTVASGLAAGADNPRRR